MAGSPFPGRDYIKIADHDLRQLLEALRYERHPAMIDGLLKTSSVHHRTKTKKEMPHLLSTHSARAEKMIVEIRVYDSLSNGA